jgi:nicotinate-nucleotide adenylyltransferase
VTRVAFFGGTFDPVHNGHLEPARRACAALRLDALYFVPAARPPHKLGETMTSYSHRFAMLALACQDDPHFLISDVEVERSGPSYTFDTLLTLRERAPATEHYFVMGSDSLVQIATWHRWQELVELVHLVVLHRRGAWGDELVSQIPTELRPRLTRVVASPSVSLTSSEGMRIYLLEHEPVPIAATDLRARCGRGVTIDGLVPEVVARYIAKHRLYHQEVTGADGP